MKRMNRMARPSPSQPVRYLGIIAGALLSAAGLELFLMPHGLVVGGMTGLSALFAHVTELRLGLYLFLFNLPFIFLARRQISRRFAFYTVLGLSVFSTAALLLHSYPGPISEPLPAAAAGGLCLGVGIGIAVRSGGLDLSARKHGYALLGAGAVPSAEVMIMLLNCGLLLLAGFLFGWEQAMYSIIAYLLAFEGLRFTLRDLEAPKALLIASSRAPEVRAALMRELSQDALIVDDAWRDGRQTLFVPLQGGDAEQIKALVSALDAESVIEFQRARRPRFKRKR